MIKLTPYLADDIPEIIAIGALAHAESKYKHLPFSEYQCYKTLNDHLTSKDALGLKLVADKIVGFFMAAKSEMIFTDVPIALETCYFILPEYRGGKNFFLMMNAFNDWAAGMPQIVMPHFKEDNSKTYSALEKVGFIDAGKLMTRGF